MRAREERELSPLAARSYPARRAAPEEDCGLRTPFQRDRDRIVHCKAFRRLKHKTQVFVAPEGDHYRTRLTHTLEVTGISRTVARALAPQRGPRRGDRARPRPRPSAVRAHRRGRARPLPARALRRRVPPLGALAAHRRPRSSATAAASTSPSRCATGSSATPGARRAAGDARGRDRPDHRPLRLPQPRHRRRPARRRARRWRRCPAEAIAVLGDTGSTRIDALVHDLVEHSERAGAIVQGERAAQAMSALRDFMFEHVYMGEVARREHAKIETRRAVPVRALLRAPGGAAAVRRRSRAPRHRLHRRDDRPLLHPRLPGARRPAGVRALMARYTEESIRARQGRRRHGRSRRRADRAAARQRGLLQRPVPVSRRAHAVVQRQALREGLLLLRLPGERRRDPLRAGDRGPRLRRRGRVPRRPLRRHARARRGGPAARPSAGGDASACYELLDRTCALLRARPVGLRRGRPRARVPRAAAASRRRCCASSASASRRAPGTACSPASRRSGFSEAELLAAGLVQRSRERPGSVYARFRRRITFPLCDRAAACSASARAR